MLRRRVRVELVLASRECRWHAVEKRDVGQRRVDVAQIGRDSLAEVKRARPDPDEGIRDRPCNLLGSGPKEICRPKGTTPDAFAGVVLDSSSGACDGRLAASTTWAVRLSNAGPATSEPAPRSPPFRMARREWRCWNHSCCSARLRCFAMSGVMCLIAMPDMVRPRLLKSHQVNGAKGGTIG
jgi:hypothetical protein